MKAKQAIEQIEKLTILSLTRLDKNLKLKDELADLLDKYMDLAVNYNINNEMFTGQIATAKDEVTNLLCANADLRHQLRREMN